MSLACGVLLWRCRKRNPGSVRASSGLVSSDLVWRSSAGVYPGGVGAHAHHICKGSRVWVEVSGVTLTMRALIQPVLPLLPLRRARYPRPVVPAAPRILEREARPQEGDYRLVGRHIRVHHPLCLKLATAVDVQFPKLYAAG